MSMPAGQPTPADPLLEVLSLCLNKDIGAALFADAESARQQAAGCLMDAVRGALTLSEGLSGAPHGHLVCLLFRLLFACLPRALSRRAHSRQYFQLLVDIVTTTEAKGILLFDPQGREECVHPAMSAELCLPLSGVLSCLCALLVACPSFERRATEGPGRRGADETLSGIARLISLLLPNLARVAPSEEEGWWFTEAGCARWLVAHLLQSCLYPESSCTVGGYERNSIAARLQECCDMPTLVGAVAQRCVRAVGTAVGSPAGAVGDGLDIGGAATASLRQQAACLPKAKTEGSRAACENLLKVLCAGSAQCAEEAASITIRQLTSSTVGSSQSQGVEGQPRVDSSLLDGALELRGADRGGAVGVVNPGSVCYAASVLQLLFSSAELRAAVLSLDLTLLSPGSVSEEFLEIVTAVQLLFARMLYGQQPAVSVEPVVAAMRDEQGRPFLPSEQQDAVRVMTKILSAIEQVGCVLVGDQLSLPHQGKIHFLKHILSGDFAHEFRAQTDDCDPELEKHLQFARHESYFYIGVGVGPDRKNLSDSLARLFGEVVVLPSYNWAARVASSAPSLAAQDLSFDTEKKTKISALPRVLAVHLQRYAFDYENHCQVKVNDRLEFPDQWEVPSEYCTADCDGEKSYRLSGVVVHCGSALSGHYKSYVKSPSQAGCTEPTEVIEESVFQVLRQAVVDIGNSLLVEESGPMIDQDRGCGEGDPPSTATLKSLTSLLTAREAPPQRVTNPAPPPLLPPAPPSVVEEDSAAALSALSRLLSKLQGEVCSDAEPPSWVECDDDRLTYFDNGGIPKAAYGWAPVESSSSGNKKKHKKAKAKAEDGSSAMVLFYRRDETQPAPFAYLEINNVIKLWAAVSRENEEYWRGVHYPPHAGSGATTGLSLLRWLTGGEHSSRPAVRFHAQQADILSLLRGGAERRAGGSSPELRVDTAHWWLSLISDCGGGGGCSLRDLVDTVGHRGATTKGNSGDIGAHAAVSLLLQAIRMGLAARPFPDEVLVGKNSVDPRMFEHYVSLDGMQRTDGALAQQFCSPYPFLNHIMRCIPVDEPLAEHRALLAMDVLETYASHSAATRFWLIGQGVVEYVTCWLCSDTTDNLIKLEDWQPQPLRSWERRALGVLAAVLAPCSVRAAEQNDWSEDEGEGYTPSPASGFEALSETERTLLLGPRVLHRLLSCMDCHSARAAVSGILSFVVLSRERTQAVLVAVVAGLDALGTSPTVSPADGTVAKSLMRAVLVLCSIQDELTDWRTDVVLSATLASIARNLPAPNDKVWLTQNEGCLQFVLTLLQNAEASKGQAMIRSIQSSFTAEAPEPLNLGSSAQAGAARYVDSDDEPEGLVGRRVSVMWSGGRRYCGTVTGYRATADLHDVRYDDGEEKSYSLSNGFSARSVSWSLL